MVFVLLAAACGTTSDGDAIAPSPSPSVTASPTAVPDVEATLYFVDDTLLGLRLFPETRTIPGDADAALATVRALVEGIAPVDPDLSSPWVGSGTKVLSLTRSAGEVVLDIELGRLNVGAEGEQRAIDQILWTLVAADPQIEALRITSGGQPIESLAGHVDTFVSFTLGPDDAVLTPVAILEPQQGATVTSPVRVTGEACTFEANVAWELTHDGTVIDSGSTLASESCPVRSPWSLDLGDLEPGDYTISAAEYSAKDGSLVVEDTKDFTVSG